MPRRMKGAMSVGKAAMKSHYRQRFNFTVAITNSAASVWTFSLSQIGGLRWTTISDQYQFYRFTKVKMTVYPFSTSVSAAFANDAVVVGYQPGAPNTVPTTWGDIGMMDAILLLSTQCTTPRTLTLGRLDLLRDTEFPWFKTRVGLDSLTLEQQGVFFGINAVNNTGTSMSQFYVEFTSECDFAGPVAATMTYTQRGLPPRVRSPPCDSEDEIKATDLDGPGEIVDPPEPTHGVSVLCSRTPEKNSTAIVVRAKGLAPAGRDGQYRAPP